MTTPTGVVMGAKLTGNHLPQARLLRRQQRAHPCPDMQVLAWGDENMLARPCVDCGLKTGCFCDHCQACDRCPKEEWADGQMTPLCTNCDTTQITCLSSSDRTKHHKCPAARPCY